MSSQATTFPRFLELPPELRNLIYEEVTAAQTRLQISSAGTICGPTLAFVSKELRNEFLPIWEANDFTTIKTIEAKALDCNFEPLIKVLSAFPTDRRPPLDSEIRLSAPWSKCVDNLETWLRYCHETGKFRRRARYYHLYVDRKKWRPGEIEYFRWKGHVKRGRTNAAVNFAHEAACDLIDIAHQRLFDSLDANGSAVHRTDLHDLRDGRSSHGGRGADTVSQKSIERQEIKKIGLERLQAVISSDKDPGGQLGVVRSMVVVREAAEQADIET